MFHHRRPSTRSLIGRALLAGVSAGLRSMTPGGVMARTRDDAPARTGWKDWPMVRSSVGRSVLQLAWIGELVGDKLPVTPPRTEPGSLTGRIVTGALTGLAITSGVQGAAPKMTGILAGGTGALAGSYGGYAGRTFLTEKLKLPDLPGALLEDALAFSLAYRAITGKRPTR